MSEPTVQFRSVHSCTPISSEDERVTVSRRSAAVLSCTVTGSASFLSMTIFLCVHVFLGMVGGETEEGETGIVTL